MKKLILSVSAAAAALSATPAFAQAAGPMSGLRIEGHAGWDRLSVTSDYVDGPTTVTEEGHEDGIVYGGEIGYDMPLGTTFNLGAYVGVDFSTTDVCEEVFGEDEGCLEAGRSIHVGVRGGFPIGPTSQVFVRGGYTNGRLNLNYEDFEDIIDDFEVGQNLDGFHVGAGVEFGLGGGSYLSGQYLYTSFGEGEFDEEDFTAGAGLSRHQLMAGFGFRF